MSGTFIGVSVSLLRCARDALPNFLDRGRERGHACAGLELVSAGISLAVPRRA